MAGINYRPEIDGLRAFAVIPVILFHLGLSSIPGGFIGVDVFFVISGFLITSIIKKELDQGSFSFRNFWARRVRRILPAMAFVTAATLIVTYFFVFRPDQQAIGKQAVAALLSVANIYFWQTSGDYWGKAAEESPFLHTWSLSVEEQFYLFFPVIMWLIYRFRTKWLRASILVITIASLALFLWGMTTHRDATFYLLPARAWELGTGCLLALSLRSQSPNNSRLGIFALAGIGMVVASYLFVDKLNEGLVLAVAGTALIIAFGQTGFSYKLLSQRPAVHIGKLSYSLYLWHWPVLVIPRHLGLDSPSPFYQLVLIGVIYLLALGTYHLIEKPTRRINRITPILIASGLVFVLAYAMALAPRYYANSEVNRGVFYLEFYNIHPERQFPASDPRHLSFDMPAREHDDDIYKRGGIITLRDSSTPEIVLLGDSLAVQWAKNVDLIAEKYGFSTSFYAMYSWCPFCTIPPSGDESDWQFKVEEAMLSHLSRWKPKVVVIGQRWVHSPNSVEGSIPLLEFLGQNGIQVLLIEMTGELKSVQGNGNAVQGAAFEGIKPSANSNVYVPLLDENCNSIPHKLAARFSHVSVIKIQDLYSQNKEILLFDGLDPVFADGVHLSQHGAMLALPRLEEAILKAME